MTKHAFGVYSTAPPETPFRHEDLQEQVDALPRRVVLVDHAGPVTIESYVVMYDSEGAEVGHAACLLPDGERTWGNITDRSLAEAMTREEFCGRPGRLDGAGRLEITG